MRDFTWHVFKQTGDIEAYLLYREMNDSNVQEVVEDGLLEDEAIRGDEE
ncbi:MAG: YqzL family protein [Candidatus Cohnella colombiensis]|uniref:YqzL family protein n=1 Tax=Candidatus Cohnella colombiensis TaxID=3121368 RepID=A0AA95EXE3_9BACL|nr:MAG: YqzL family protein [Cohnella sp.]